MSKLTEDELFKALGGHKQEVAPDSPPVIGMHRCISCVLALIPDESPRQLCHFCSRTKNRGLQRTPTNP